ncbi:MarR family transcriptional regulator [Phaeodactylibacter sp.]|jgi:DNA-binding MarR family transcriptional regulator|uniref:MarR family winged helix-turn-helix transcriptional regulator n=1 Tax=Phaeodactylibacter sp. TaxID=1940289 RepID=UPI0025EC42FC|nr:MarR family transcriptional regulator [Phaeodactylibacter sp.]MCI4646761.1 MarR family transcriptional regulator [Phaeodactylibacter sp.]MCI5090233.1 MarR family transcriptional regulator [Phaeodactylibacter sp.]
MSQAVKFPINSLVFLTNRVGRLLANEIRKRTALDELGLSAQHMGILVDLWVKEGVRQQDLAVSNIKDKGTIARALQSLEAANIVVRIPDQEDKRNKLIYLTHRGRSLREELLPEAQQTVQEATEGIPEEDLAICKRVLSQIYQKFTCNHK